MSNPTSNEELDEFPDDLDFGKLEGGVRGKYAERFREGTNVVLLAPDLLQHFPNSDAVNAALRSFLQSTPQEE